MFRPCALRMSKAGACEVQGSQSFCSADREAQASGAQRAIEAASSEATAEQISKSTLQLGLMRKHWGRIHIVRLYVQFNAEHVVAERCSIHHAQVIMTIALINSHLSQQQ